MDEEMDKEIDVNSICSEIQSSVLKATKCVSSLPSLDFTLLMNYEKFAKMMKHETNIALTMLSSVIQNESKAKRIETLTDDDDKFDLLCDINDNMLDAIGNYLDDASGIKKRDAELVMATINKQSNHSDVNTSGDTSSWNRKVIKGRRVATNGGYQLLSAKVVQRPQFKFKDKIDNSNRPFVPIIKDKPNSIKPLAILPEVNDDGFDSYSHPYELEIEKFTPNDTFLQLNASPKMPKPVEQCAHKFVSTKDELIKMNYELKLSKEIAVDLEHHSYRTFQGFTCLIQISTRTCDYIVDALELRSELHLLNEVFTSPAILKVFHGSDMDIIWLQRDFGVYVVNLFDTGHAAKLLNFPHLSLSFLLKHYCNIDADKKYQLADWRLRPLTSEMLTYAQQDTHYLLYIYDRMKSELIAKGNTEMNLLRAVFERGRHSCLKRYEKPLFNPQNYRALLKNSKVRFNSRQCYALRELYAWRDSIARFEDECYGYVLPNHMLMNIAEVLPKEQQGILACCNPIPSLVKQQLNEIHLIIVKARDVTLTDNDFADDSVSDIVNNKSLVQSGIDLDNCFDTRHDIYHERSGDNERNVKTLLDDISDTIRAQNSIISGNRVSSEFKQNSGNFIKLFTTKNPIKQKSLLEKIESNFISPYQRYVLSVKRKSNNDNSNGDDCGSKRLKV